MSFVRWKMGVSRFSVFSAVLISLAQFICEASFQQSGYRGFYVMNKFDFPDYMLVEPTTFLGVDKLYGEGREKRAASPDDNLNIESHARVNFLPPGTTTLQIEDWLLLLEENEYFSFGKNFEERGEPGRKEGELPPKYDNKIPDCKFYTGTVLYDEDSKAIITICDGIHYYGFFSSGNKSYFLEPTVQPVNGHIVYKAKIPGQRGDDENYDIKNDVHEKIKYDENGTINDANILIKDKLDNNFVTSKKKRCIHCTIDSFNLTGDTFLDDINYNFEEEDEIIKDDKNQYKNNVDKISDNSEEDPDLRHVHWHRKQNGDDVGYFLDTAWVTRPYPRNKGSNSTTSQKERWLEIALAVDHTVIDFHGKDRIRQYIMALMNIVSAIYKDPSLDANLHIVLSRLILYDRPQDSHIKEGNAKGSLEAVNRWNYRLIGKLPRDEVPHDVAVWLTRAHLGGPSGYAPVAGVCDRARSTALNKDEGLASAFIIAHEMAHILGLTHDGDLKAGNKCDDEVSKGTIMAPTVTATFHRFAWSSCSKKELHRVIKQWTCLLNEPKTENLLQPGFTHAFTMDEQCRMEYGEGYSLCRTFELIEPCTHLWCGHKNSTLYCITKKGPPVEGTQCGFDKWCVDGYCQAVDGRLSGGRAQAGGWGEWSSWSSCSRPCGYGVSGRHRTCDNPTPAVGGLPCSGLSEEMRVCRADRRCWRGSGPYSDPRAKSCQRLTSTETLGNWLPYDTEEEELMCKVTCVKWDTGEILRSGETLPDGVACNYDNEHHICIEGKCVEMGCDGVPGSSLKEDACGVCQGKGEACKESHLTKSKLIKRISTRLLVIPRHARHVSLRVTLQPTSPHTPGVSLLPPLATLGLRDRARPSRLYRLLHKEPEDVVQFMQKRDDVSREVLSDRLGRPLRAVLGGAAFTAERQRGALTLNTRGPLHTDIVVMISSPSEYIGSVEAFVDMNYTMHEDEGRRPLKPSPSSSGRFLWKEGRCVDASAPWRAVPARRCGDMRKPSATTTAKPEECQGDSCIYQWSAGEWEHCSATCGQEGEQHRQVYCVPGTFDNNTVGDTAWQHMVSPLLCRGDPPGQVQPCNRIICPAYWEEEPWTECSSSCGHGISTRPVNCPSPDGPEACGPVPLTRWRQCTGTACPKGMDTSMAHGTCSRGDRSYHCSLPAIQRYCELPEFASLCCRSCAL